LGFGLPTSSLWTFHNVKTYPLHDPSNPLQDPLMLCWYVSRNATHFRLFLPPSTGTLHRLALQQLLIGGAALVRAKKLSAIIGLNMQSDVASQPLAGIILQVRTAAAQSVNSLLDLS
jgi:hypothetical protein